MGRTLLESDRASIASLNDMPDYVIVEARRLAQGRRVLAHLLLTYYAGRDNFRYVGNFIDDVVVNGFPASLWCKGEDFLVPSTSLIDQLCSPLERLLAPIDGFHGVRVRPRVSAWQQGSSFEGAPGARRTGRNYRTVNPNGTLSLLAPEIESVAEANIAVRRWIATRIARCLPKGWPAAVESLRANAPSVPESHAWTEDARIALRAVGRELSELDQNEEAVPGFRGPDAWYR